MDHNLVIGENYDAHFVNWGARDLRLKATSSAIDAGSAVQTPLLDVLKASRPVDGNGDTSALWDEGAYEFGSSASTPGLPTVTVSATDASAGEASGTGTFTFTRTGSTTASLTVTFSVGGSALSGIDYTSIGSSVTIPIGSASATKTVTGIPDALSEGDETVTVTLSASPNYASGVPSSGIVTIANSSAGGGGSGGGSTGSGSGKKKGGGGCGLTGLEVLLVLGLAARRRRTRA
jgi:hypothetical protein